jgi:hypothetical protein
MDNTDRDALKSIRLGGRDGNLRTPNRVWGAVHSGAENTEKTLPIFIKVHGTCAAVPFRNLFTRTSTRAALIETQPSRQAG